MQLRVRKGTTGEVVRLFISTVGGPDGQGMQGLRHDSAGATACFVHEGAARPVDIPLTSVVAGEFSPGGFREIDSATMPGLYELCIPDEALQGPGQSTVLMLRFAGAQPIVLEFDLVAYDPYDGERLGLACLLQTSRHAVLERAFREVVPALVQEYLQQIAREPHAQDR